MTPMMNFPPPRYSAHLLSSGMKSGDSDATIHRSARGASGNSDCRANMARPPGAIVGDEPNPKGN